MGDSCRGDDPTAEREPKIAWKVSVPFATKREPSVPMVCAYVRRRRKTIVDALFDSTRNREIHTTMARRTKGTRATTA
jgi:hypothetical protein